MNIRDQLAQQQSNMTHAYVLVGNTNNTQNSLFDFLQKDLGIKVRANPNVFITQYQQMGIDDAREIGVLQSRTAVGVDVNKIFVLTFDSITVEAQNALLKSIEEPSEGTLFFLLTSAESNLLSTILSRAQVLYADSGSGVDVADFVSADYVVREKYIKKYLADTKKNIPADKAGSRLFIESILSYVVNHKEQFDQWSVLYRDIEQVGQYTADRSSSVKHILEYISIRLPQV